MPLAKAFHNMSGQRCQRLVPLPEFSRCQIKSLKDHLHKKGVNSRSENRHVHSMIIKQVYAYIKLHTENI